MYRFLKARASVSEDAGTLADLIKSNRDIDAVILDEKSVDFAKDRINDCQDLTSYMISIDNKTLLLYPQEQRELYEDIRRLMLFEGAISEYGDFTYSEAKVISDYLQNADIRYQVKNHNDGISISVSEFNEDVIEKAIDFLKKEVDTEVGKNYLISANICWKNSLNCISVMLNYDGTSFVGREGGTDGIKLDKKGAVMFTSKNIGRFIPRHDPDFEKKVIDFVLNDLNGKIKPVKPVYGELAEILTEDLSPDTIKQYKGMSSKEALEVFNLPKIPDIEMLEDMSQKCNKNDKKQQHALHTLMRMNICRNMKLEDIKDVEISKDALRAYNELHEKYVNKFVRQVKDRWHDCQLPPLDLTV